MFALCHYFQVADMYNAQKHTQGNNQDDDEYEWEFIPLLWQASFWQFFK